MPVQPIARISKGLSGPFLEAFDRPPREAIKYLEGKGLQPQWDWRDITGSATHRTFGVAKLTNLSLLGDVHKELLKAQATGMSFEDFKKNLMPRMKARGWWGKTDQVNPKTGNLESVLTGSPWRLETIYRTNLQSAYQAGRYKQQIATSQRRPYWLYVSIGDTRTRPSHLRLNGAIMRADDPIWEGIYPPNGFNCRCRVQTLSQAQLDREIERSAKRLADAQTPEQLERARRLSVKVLDPDQTKSLGLVPDEGFDTSPAELFKPKLTKYPDVLAKAFVDAMQEAPPAPVVTKPVKMSAQEAREEIARLYGDVELEDARITKLVEGTSEELEALDAEFQNAHTALAEGRITQREFEQAIERNLNEQEKVWAKRRALQAERAALSEGVQSDALSEYNDKYRKLVADATSVTEDIDNTWSELYHKQNEIERLKNNLNDTRVPPSEYEIESINKALKKVQSERQELLEQIAKRGERLKELTGQIDELRYNPPAKQEAHKLFFKDEPGTYATPIKGRGVTAEQKTAAKDASDWVKRVTGSVSTGQDCPITFRAIDRAHYFDLPDGKYGRKQKRYVRGVNMEAKRSTGPGNQGVRSVTVHELGHYIEYHIPGLKDRVNKYLDLRLAGEPEVSLRSLFPNSNYDAHEYCQPDAFFSPYVGKRYSDGASELISMGLQALYDDPIKLIRDDPATFDFIWEIFGGQEPWR